MYLNWFDLHCESVRIVIPCFCATHFPASLHLCTVLSLWVLSNIPIVSFPWELTILMMLLSPLISVLVCVLPKRTGLSVILPSISPLNKSSIKSIKNFLISHKHILFISQTIYITAHRVVHKGTAWQWFGSLAAPCFSGTGIVVFTATVFSSHTL